MSKVMSKCPECGCEKLIRDGSTGEVVCTGCGLVLGPAEAEGYNGDPEGEAGGAVYACEAANALLWDRNLGTDSRSIPKRLRLYQKTSSLTAFERAVLARVADLLHAPEDEWGRAVSDLAGRIALAVAREVERRRIPSKGDVDAAARQAVMRAVLQQPAMAAHVALQLPFLSRPAKWKRLSDAELAAAAVMRARGYSYDSIARILKRPKSVVWEGLKAERRKLLEANMEAPHA
ncbi:MAG: TFIIB-type zinc ribbon-containing protein [Candidatus Bathyarchaeia archaeon]